MTFPLRLAPALVLATFLVACGSRHDQNSLSSRDKGAIRAAMRQSPEAFFYYHQRSWWGQTVSIELRSLRLSRLNSAFAGAVVVVRRPQGSNLRQIVLLERDQQRWRVVAASAKAAWIQCKLAPDGVARELFGACDRSGLPLSSEFEIRGSRYSKEATPAERTAIIATLRKGLGLEGHDRLIKYELRISRLDGRFALAQYGGLAPFNGDTLLRYGGGKWRILAEASSGYECRYAPAGVVRSLEGFCLIEGDLSR
jgi:hypothetical protein